VDVSPPPSPACAEGSAGWGLAIAGFVLTVLFFHHGGDANKPRWQDKLCDPVRSWAAPPSEIQMLYALLCAAISLLGGILLLLAVGFFEEEKPAPCYTPDDDGNINYDEPNEGAKNCGIAFTVLGAWSTFWSANVLLRVRAHRRRGAARRNAPHRAQAQPPAGGGARLQAWGGITRHAQRWERREHTVANPLQHGRYQTYALELYEHQRGARGTIQLGRISFKDEAGNAAPYVSHRINNERCHGGGGENYRNVASDARNKWCTQLEYFPNGVARFEFSFAAPVCIGAVVLQSANDCPERDPKSFALYGVGAWLAPPAAVDLPPAPLMMVEAAMAAVQPVVVEGVVVVEMTDVPAVAGSSVSVAASSSSTHARTPPLADMARLLQRELGLDASLNMPQTVELACQQLGITSTEGKSLIEKAKAAYDAIGVSS